jgi:hypothetical protein
MSIDPISTKKALESAIGIDKLDPANPERDALDREELRQVEYEEKGLRAPVRQPVSTGVRSVIRGFLGGRP